MARRNTQPPLRSRGFAWGPQRVRLGISLSELSQRVGINKGTLSYIEGGRMVPTADEYERVMSTLRDAEAAAAKDSTAAG